MAKLKGVVVLSDAKSIKAKISHADSKVAICFENLKAARKAANVLRQDLGAKSTWRNWVSFYLPLFDDYLKVYKINEKEFVLEPDGFTYMDGVALWTDAQNEALFNEVVQTLKSKLPLVLEN